MAGPEPWVEYRALTLPGIKQTKKKKKDRIFTLNELAQGKRGLQVVPPLKLKPLPPYLQKIPPSEETKKQMKLSEARRSVSRSSKKRRETVAEEQKARPVMEGPWSRPPSIMERVDRPVRAKTFTQ